MKIIVYILSVLLFVSCAESKKDIKETKIETPEELYKLGIKKLENRDYKEAAKEFDNLEQNFPFSELVSDSIIMQIYSQYLDRNYLSALSDIERFVLLYPYHKDMSYVLYLKALCYYNQIRSAKLDQEITELAGKAFRDLLEKYPNSKFAKDAKYKLDLVYSNLASKEMITGRFYLENYKIAAALSRFQIVVQKYQNTIYIEEALYRMSEGFYLLGNYEEAVKYAAVLNHNYPNSIWYKRAYELLGNKVK